MTEEQDTVLRVTGMTCGGCVRHVGGALRAVPGVRDVDVRLAEGMVRVKHDAAQAPVGALVAAVEEAGYGAAPSAP